ncbi:hypothetical protein PFICI_12224 [Pestalotiopsis fici W106-1]|uniref:Phospholipase/carboxylesterase/thioesterase domain-containing protein n=1 Tax=Pestalotiopsis fici (strain W106-1 / CGMCC3.15140) TaxID=1229662 RepID=W3WN02_PESFW|nr:uncharacterized protein PFICI_12224 [Pestalotiopsis fici W106-1]ETS75280.1 hypothetical protein PFICI_12224 [Pestalotiopsis fici W106-1]
MAPYSYIVQPQKGHGHTHTIIFLHGKGSNGEECANELFESETSEHYAPRGPQTLVDLFPTVRWIFLSAPQTQSTRFDCIESQWFDMWSVENPEEQVDLQVEGLAESILLLRQTIAEEESKVPQQKMFLAGISQGFATAITAFLLDEFHFAGLVGLCSWMPMGAYRAIENSKKVEIRSNGNTTRVPVFLGHSRDDNVVPIDNGLALRDFLSEREFAVEWHEYSNGGHWINEPRGVEDVVGFLQSNGNCS